MRRVACGRAKLCFVLLLVLCSEFWVGVCSCVVAASAIPPEHASAVRLRFCTFSNDFLPTRTFEPTAASAARREQSGTWLCAASGSGTVHVWRLDAQRASGVVNRMPLVSGERAFTSCMTPSTRSLASISGMVRNETVLYAWVVSNARTPRAPTAEPEGRQQAVHPSLCSRERRGARVVTRVVMKREQERKAAAAAAEEEEEEHHKEGSVPGNTAPGFMNSGWNSASHSPASLSTTSAYVPKISRILEELRTPLTSSGSQSYRITANGVVIVSWTAKL